MARVQVALLFITAEAGSKTIVLASKSRAGLLGFFLMQVVSSFEVILAEVLLGSLWSGAELLSLGCQISSGT